MNESTLSRRKREILRDLVQEFVRTGKPEGSRRLAELNRERLSSASIRTVVVELERESFLSQPHTSAGRMPTAKGYSLYVNSLIRLRAEDNAISERQQAGLGSAFATPGRFSIYETVVHDIANWVLDRALD